MVFSGLCNAEYAKKRLRPPPTNVEIWRRTVRFAAVRSGLQRTFQFVYRHLVAAENPASSCIAVMRLTPRITQ
ncbi:MAG: hypothetical protein DMG85_03100 [Acidobacteria bacterium]|nr:MAG: hypothetical protein DMG85_03100 [Acidobacteriota bacterium]